MTTAPPLSRTTIPVAAVRVNPIPRELRKRDQWTNWKLEPDDKGKLTKVPYRPNGTKAKSNDPATWSSRAAVRQAMKDGSGFSGIGFFFGPNDQYCGIDLDNCIDDEGNVKSWADEILQRFPETYMEVSPSGKGVHIFIRGKLTSGIKIKPYYDGAVEAYDHGRYFTVTGRPFENAPSVVRDHQEALDWLYARLKKTKPATNGHAAGVGIQQAAATSGKKVGQGMRHPALVAYAMSLRNLGLEKKQILRHLIRFGRERCSPPKTDEREIGSIAQWAGSKTPNFIRTEGANAECLVAWYGAEIRWVRELKRWATWNGKIWETDDGGALVRLLARDLVRGMQTVASEIDDDDKRKALFKFALASDNRRSFDNIVNLARDHCSCAVEEFDTKPWLLVVKNGTFDLHTGKMRGFRRRDLITKLVPWEYRPEARCPQFLAFLERITSRHPELISYLQRAFGYSLTGVTSEKVAFLLHGPKDTGKSTLLDIFRMLLGKHATRIMIGSLMTREDSNNALADLADLRGARFAQTSETEEGQRLSEGKLKRITQGMGHIKSCRKYENPIEFEETHKLWIDANHLPEIQGTDNAIWQRLHPIPFDTVVPKSEQNRELSKRLVKEEGEGILAWGVAGALEWQRKGLQPPECVQIARKKWRKDSDAVGRFFAQNCVVDKQVTRAVASRKNSITASALYVRYQSWCEANGGKGNPQCHCVRSPISDSRTGKKGNEIRTFDGLGWGGAAMTSREVWEALELFSLNLPIGSSYGKERGQIPPMPPNQRCFTAAQSKKGELRCSQSRSRTM